MSKFKIRYLVAAAVMLSSTLSARNATVSAATCPELKVIFARGSGEEYQTSESYQAFKQSLDSKLTATGIRYEIKDLNYPAVSIDNVLTALGALIGSGDAYKFGDSVNEGAAKIVAEVNGACTDTKYVIAGYSQGAIAVHKALRQIDSDQIIYVATFGDPKIYLPEGAGAVPAACRGENLSEYRMYVPDCRAFLGILGTYVPYQPNDYAGKFGTWCNRMDIICSSYLSINDHVSYAKDNIYEDASKVIFDKITAVFGIENNFTAPHETAILIDSTASMSSLIEKYKDEALRLAKETLASGGKVALYDYRDYREENALIRRCDFTCTLEEFEAGLAAIEVGGGGDARESLLGASFSVMKELKWEVGMAKSLVILTDDGYHDPDFDDRRTTLADVVNLSKQIDPVNIYVITTDIVAPRYAELTSLTGGRVATTVDDLSMLTDEIMSRYDSLPRVEEWLDDGEELPWAEITRMSYDDGVATIHFCSSNDKVIVALNDMLLGIVEGGEVTIGKLNDGTENIVTLVPISDARSGIPVSITITESSGQGMFVPLAPNTGGI